MPDVSYPDPSARIPKLALVLLPLLLAVIVAVIFLYGGFTGNRSGRVWTLYVREATITVPFNPADSAIVSATMLYQIQAKITHLARKITPNGFTIVEMTVEPTRGGQKFANAFSVPPATRVLGPRLNRSGRRFDSPSDLRVGDVINFSYFYNLKQRTGQVSDIQVLIAP